MLLLLLPLMPHCCGDATTSTSTTSSSNNPQPNPVIDTGAVSLANFLNFTGADYVKLQTLSASSIASDGAQVPASTQSGKGSVHFCPAARSAMRCRIAASLGHCPPICRTGCYCAFKSSDCSGLSGSAKCWVRATWRAAVVRVVA